MARVLVSAPLAGGAIAPLLAAHEVDIGEAPTGLPRDELLRRVADKEALVALLSNRIDDELLDRAPALRVVANHAVGVDNVDLEACKRRGVVVTNTPDVLSDATADFTFALLLAACRRLTEADRLARSGTWPGWSPTELCGVRVTGATLGIVGLGRIGQAVARRARGFGMRVVYAQRRRAAVEIERELSAEHRSLEALLAESDVVSLHCPLTPETHHLLDERRLAAMKPGAVLVNTARGGCVDAPSRARSRAVTSRGRASTSSRPSPSSSRSSSPRSASSSRRTSPAPICPRASGWGRSASRPSSPFSAARSRAVALRRRESHTRAPADSARLLVCPSLTGTYFGDNRFDARRRAPA